VVLFAERLDPEDQTGSAEQLAVALERCNQRLRRLGRIAQRLEERDSAGAAKEHALVLLQNPARAFVGEVARRRPGYRHGSLNDLLGCRREPQLHALGLALSGDPVSAASR
jgi:hypothetical protein